MKTQIHPYLLARLVAVQEAFSQPGYRPVTVAKMAAPAPRKQGNNWQDVIKKEEEEDQGGGGGTARGLRGKQVEQAKAAMRRLQRSR